MKQILNFEELTERDIPPIPWAEGEKIPWNDPEFSARMLKEHLSQEHNAASRRTQIIDEHVNWLHSDLLSGSPSRVLDLGCGPGLYTSRFSRLGHSCVGIDFSPASIAHARDQADKEGLDCSYIEGDVRTSEFGGECDLIMMVHGEINVFQPDQTRAILTKARRALKDRGKLVLEVHTMDAVQAIGERGSRWSALSTGLFSARPHLLLKECFWDDSLKVSTERYYILDGESGEVTRHALSIQGYEESAYHELFTDCGFTDVKQYPSLGGIDGEKDQNYVVFIATTGVV